VEDVHAVLDQLVGGDLLRVLAFLHEAAFQAVLDVGQLDAAVADRAAAVAVEDGGGGAFGGADFVGVAEEQALVAAVVGDEFDVGRDLGLALDQAGDGGAEAGGEAAGSEEGDFFGTGGGGAHGERESALNLSGSRANGKVGNSGRAETDKKARPGRGGPCGLGAGREMDRV